MSQLNTNGIPNQYTRPQQTAPQVSNPVATPTANVDMSGVTQGINQGFSNLAGGMNQGFEQTNQNITGGFNNLNNNLGIVNENVGAVGNAVQQGFDQFGNLIDTGFNQTNNNINSGFSNLGEQVGNVGNMVNTVGQGVAQVGNQVTQGFQQQQEQMSNIGNGLSAGIGGLGTQIAEQSTATANALGNMNQNVTSGIAANQAGFSNMDGRFDTLASTLASMSDRQNSGFSTLATAADKSNQTLTGLNSGFNRFRSDYNTNTTRNDQSQTQIKNAVAGAVSTLGDRIDQGYAGTQEAINNLRSGMTPVQQVQTNNMMSNVAGSSFNQQQEQINQAGQISQQIAQMRQVMATQGNNIPPDLASTFNLISGSFDQNGQLIPESIGQNGVRTFRQMDPQGNLNYSQTDQNGQLLSQTLVNLNSSFNMANSLGMGGQQRLI